MAFTIDLKKSRSRYYGSGESSIFLESEVDDLEGNDELLEGDEASMDSVDTEADRNEVEIQGAESYTESLIRHIEADVEAMDGLTESQEVIDTELESPGETVSTESLTRAYGAKMIMKSVYDRHYGKSQSRYLADRQITAEIFKESMLKDYKPKETLTYFSESISGFITRIWDLIVKWVTKIKLFIKKYVAKIWFYFNNYKSKAEAVKKKANDFSSKFNKTLILDKLKEDDGLDKYIEAQINTLPLSLLTKFDLTQASRVLNGFNAEKYSKELESIEKDINNKDLGPGEAGAKAILFFAKCLPVDTGMLLNIYDSKLYTKGASKPLQELVLKIKNDRFFANSDKGEGNFNPFNYLDGHDDKLCGGYFVRIKGESVSFISLVDEDNELYRNDTYTLKRDEIKTYFKQNLQKDNLILEPKQIAEIVQFTISASDKLKDLITYTDSALSSINNISTTLKRTFALGSEDADKAKEVRSNFSGLIKIITNFLPNNMYGYLYACKNLVLTSSSLIDYYSGIISGAPADTTTTQELKNNEKVDGEQEAEANAKEAGADAKGAAATESDVLPITAGDPPPDDTTPNDLDRDLTEDRTNLGNAIEGTTLDGESHLIQGEQVGEKDTAMESLTAQVETYYRNRRLGRVI